MKHTHPLPVAPLDHEKYMSEQVRIALTCHINRHMTRLEHKCSDQDLFEHPEWLLDHFIANGGAEAFAKRRAEFQEQVCDMADDCGMSEGCQFLTIRRRWSHCPIRNMSCKANCKVDIIVAAHKAEKAEAEKERCIIWHLKQITLRLQKRFLSPKSKPVTPGQN